MAPLPVLNRIFYAPERILNRALKTADRGFKRVFFGNINNVRPAVTPQGIEMRPPVEQVNPHDLMNMRMQDSSSPGTNGTPGSTSAPSAPARTSIDKEQADTVLYQYLHQKAWPWTLGIGVAGGLGLSLPLAVTIGIKLFGIAVLAGAMAAGAAVLVVPAVILVYLVTKGVQTLSAPEILKKARKDLNSPQARALAQTAIERGKKEDNKLKWLQPAIKAVEDDYGIIRSALAPSRQTFSADAEGLITARETLAQLQAAVRRLPIETIGDNLVQRSQVPIQRLTAEIAALEKRLTPDELARANKRVFVGETDQYVGTGAIPERGGTAYVHFASDSQGEEYAVKVFRPQNYGRLSAAQRSKLLRRFREEIRIMQDLAELESPHIIELVDTGKIDKTAIDDIPVVEQLFYVMEKADNTLEKLIKAGTVDRNLALQLIIHTATGLKHAYEMGGTINRDVKPSNVMVVNETNGDRTGKISDFGFGKITEDPSVTKLTVIADVFGTLDYLAPEVISKMGWEGIPDKEKVLCDIYSLGLTLYRALTGEEVGILGSVPDNQNAQQIAALMGEKISNLIRGLDLGKTLDQIIAKMVNPNPKERYQNYADIIADLQTALAEVTSAPGEQATAVEVPRPLEPEREVVMEELPEDDFDVEVELTQTEIGAVPSDRLGDPNFDVSAYLAGLPEAPVGATPELSAENLQEPASGTIDQLTFLTTMWARSGQGLTLDDTRALQRFHSGDPTVVLEVLEEIACGQIAFEQAEIPKLEELFMAALQTYPADTEITEGIEDSRIFLTQLGLVFSNSQRA